MTRRDLLPSATDPATPVEPAALELRDGQPWSSRYADVYFSETGVDETRRVFVALNKLTERFSALAPDGRITIAEVGFGTGLNLLVTASAFLESAPQSATLHYITCERAPFAHSAQAAMPRDPRVRSLATEMSRGLPPRLPGWHRRWLFGGRVQLSLYYGEAIDAYRELAPASVDAWFLDGFAPARNADAWSEQLAERIAHASHCQSTLATFSAAGSARRALTRAGFLVSRIDGTPHKRHYLMARGNPEWPPPTPRPQRVVVAGTGIASAWVTHALTRRGVAVEVVGEPNEFASANPWAVLHSRLTARNPALAAIRLQAFALATEVLGDTGFTACGVLQLPGPVVHEADLAECAQWLQDCWPYAQLLEPEAASEAAGMKVATRALWFPTSGWADLRALSKRLLEPAMQGSASLAHADVLATGGFAPVPPTLLPGRIDAFQAIGPRPKAVLTGNGYLIPGHGVIVSGATYERTQPQQKTDTSARDRVAGWLGWEPGRSMGGWRGVRATTPDRLPCVGLTTSGQWMCAGFASTGLSMTPLAGEIVASGLCGEPPPTSLADLLNANRFQTSVRSGRG